MKTKAQEITVQAQGQESVAESSSQVGIGIIAFASALIGTWSVACLIGAISQYGITGVIKGWFSAVMGL
ncbi:MAG: hypothetical protein KQH63_17035 [Desulfobulbaceae bacterium]|nr:hypothetical protein [Desulfobulbaceae bacterium]